MSLYASGLQKNYNGRVVLDVDLEFTDGRLYSILGPNGSGKSTLLKIMAGLEEPEQGRVNLGSSSKRPVLVPARKGLFNDTVLRNASYGLKIRKVANTELQRRVEEVLKAVELWELRRSNALSLSDGEAQRLCLAMAMAIEPGIILLDEPTSSLDPQNTMLVEKLIAGMKKPGRLIIMVTHNIFQAERLSDYAAFLYQGKIHELAKSTKFFKNPENQLVRDFLKGEMIY